MLLDALNLWIPFKSEDCWATHQDQNGVSNTKAAQNKAMYTRLALILFLNKNPGVEKPFFLSSGSLNMTICSNRKTRLSLQRGKSPVSWSVTTKVSCSNNLPWATILP